MNLDNLLIFATENGHNYYPFSIMHPLWELRVGALRIFEKYQHEFPSTQFHYNSDNDLLDSFCRRFNFQDSGIKKGNLLALDTRILPTNDFIKEIKSIIDVSNQSCLLMNQTNPIGLYLIQKDLEKSDEFSNLKLLSNLEVNLFSKLKKIEINNCLFLNYLFEAIEYNSSALIEDLKYFRNSYQPIKTGSNYFLLEEENIYCGENIVIAPNVVLDARQGPIIIGNNVQIMPQATIIGPSYIGDNSVIKIGAKLYQNVSIGEYCRVGGEIENSIFQSYANKQHDGFVGDSFISEWVNLGADTNTSNLKNNYAPIKIKIENEEINTGMMFLGLLCGDHTKSGINSMFNTGTICGISAMLVDEWYQPKFIPSFMWGGGKKSTIYEFDKAIETARVVMQRRGKILTDEEIHLMKKEHKRISSLYSK